MIGPRSDAGGLEVGVPPGTAAHVAPAAIASSVALTYVDAAPVVPAWSRWDDTEPFRGGGGIENQTDFSLCSTAFSVTTSTGAPGMLTAAHCGALNTNWASIWTTRPYGKATIRRADRDTAVITGKTYDPYGYVGNAALGSSTGIPVGGEASQVVGAKTCVSGSFSGYKCNLKITNVGMTVPIQNFGTVFPMFRTLDLDGKGSVGNGDSGGPVFSLISSGTKAGAMGIISGMDTSAPNAKPCMGVTGADVPGRGCSQVDYHVNLLRVEIDLSLRLKTA